MSRIVLAMSGGVDSSVAAHLLRAAGHDVVGVFMRHGETVETACGSRESEKGSRESGDGSREREADAGAETARSSASSFRLPVISARADHKQGCCSASDAADARRVADRLEIPFYAIDMSAEFGRIIDYFVSEYQSARTPNPCVMCNNWLKFGKLFEYADSIGAEFVATGHYARIESGDRAMDGTPTMTLRRGLDASKDQSYVLFGVDRQCLPRMMLPVGGYRKAEIRDLARQIGLRVAEKKDSQEICFVNSGEHAEFVRRRGARPSSAGEIVLTDGTVVGHHEGLESFTIGQRKGLGIAFGEPRYVVRLESDSRRVVIGTRDELRRMSLTAHLANWLVEPPTAPRRCLAQIRYNSRAVPATLEPTSAHSFQVQFDEPQNGVAPGQAVVCYSDDRVLGGGWIE